MGALAREPVEVRGKGRDQRLALTGLHLGDPAEVQRGAADHLDVVVTLPEHPTSGLADDGERLDEDVIKLLAIGQPLTELTGLGLQGAVAQGLRLGLERGDVGNDGLDGLQLLALTRAEDLVEDAHEGTSLPMAPEAQGFGPLQRPISRGRERAQRPGAPHRS